MTPSAPTALEVATTRVFGLDPEVVVPTRGPRPRERLEQLMLDALRSGPLGIAFSGGCDSSVLLALATRVARREGLAAPVPITGVYPELPETDEQRWQELVIGHLGLEDWVRIETTTEQNLLGAYARRALDLLGLHYTPTLYNFLPYLEHLPGGTLAIGIDGDTVFQHQGFARQRAALWGPVRLRARDVPALGLVVAPRVARQLRFFGTAERNSLPWLRPQAELAYRWARAGDLADVPLNWQARTKWVARLRSYSVMRANLEALAAGVDSRVSLPLLDPAFLGALGKYGGNVGFVRREDALLALFGDLLPEAVLRRRDKAHFTRALFSGETRDFIAGWGGTGVDERYVDVDRLRAEWEKELPHYGSSLLLQQAWLHSARR